MLGKCGAICPADVTPCSQKQLNSKMDALTLDLIKIAKQQNPS